MGYIFFKYKNVIKIAAIVLAFFIILVDVSISTYALNKKRVFDGKKPLFILHADYLNDGGSIIYYGLGYQIITWCELTTVKNESSTDIEVHYLTGIETHYLFKMVDPMKGPTVELIVDPAKGPIVKFDDIK